MGRRKIEIKAIKDDRNRSVTFLKRKSGLFKKAHELAVLCSVDVTVIIFGHNKKLYEFSSADIQETLGRYQYYGPPHEHKGPEDFTGKRNTEDEDDEDDNTPAPEEGSANTNANPPVTHPQYPNQAGFQHANPTQSASPPVPNGLSFMPHHGTPQPQGGSRPTSRNHVRHGSSHLGPQHQQHQQTPPQHHSTPPPPLNGFTYVPNPSMYNPNQPPSRPPHFAQYPTQSMQQPAGPPHPPQHHVSHAGGPSHASHSQAQHVAPAYAQDQGGRTVPTTFPPDQAQHPALHQHQQQQQQQQQRASLPHGSPPEPFATQPKSETTLSPPQPQRTLSSKSRSIFTPIDDRGSMLARHFGVGPPITESPSAERVIKSEPPQDELAAVSATEAPVASSAPALRKAEPPRTQSLTGVSKNKPPIPSHSTQLPSKRPQLKVQIPSESSDRGSATAESASSAGTKPLTPARMNPDGTQSSVVLPPPSPSASAILSAGATGPPNPFARPPPPAVAPQNNAAAFNNNNNNIETPISALPSRFVSDALLPSPSSFFPEWGFSRSSGPDTNMLPSPLTFPTPAVPTGPNFPRDEEAEKKRKSPDSGPPLEGVAKKVKS